MLDPASKGTALLSLELYSDSDWAGCPETRRSTDNIAVCLGGFGGAVVQTSCQTQPGLRYLQWRRGYEEYQEQLGKLSSSESLRRKTLP